MKYFESGIDRLKKERARLSQREDNQMNNKRRRVLSIVLRDILKFTGYLLTVTVAICVAILLIIGAVVFFSEHLTLCQLCVPLVSTAFGVVLVIFLLTGFILVIIVISDVGRLWIKSIKERAKDGAN